MHSYVLRAPKFAHFQTKTYWLALWCTVLTWNEQRRSKQLAPAVVRRTKYHPDGVLEQRQHRSLRQEWQLAVLSKCFDAALVQVWVQRQRDYMVAATERRAKVVAAAEQEHAAMLAERVTLAAQGGGLVTGVVDPYPLVQPKMVLVCADSVRYAAARPFEAKWQKPPHPMSRRCDELRVSKAVEATEAAEQAARAAEADSDNEAMRTLFTAGAAQFNVSTMWPEVTE